MKFVDYYQVMGIAEDASADTIKKVYRKLARKYHPDVSQETDAEAKFKELGEAYEVLKDPDKRREYDDLRTHGTFDEGEFRPPPDWHSNADFGAGGYTEVDPAQFSEFFESLFGRGYSQRPGAAGDGAARRQFSMRGEDILYTIAVPLEEAFSGSTRTIALQLHEFDATGTPTPKTKTLRVTIPAGVTQDQKIRLRGQGNPGLGKGASGDLYLQVDLLPHPQFTVDGRNLTLVVPVTPWEAALGATIDVPTLTGAVKLNIPANTKSGQKLRLKSKGLPGNPAGDLFVVAQLVLPDISNDADRELFRKMEQQMGFDPRAQMEHSR